MPAIRADGMKVFMKDLSNTCVLPTKLFSGASELLTPAPPADTLSGSASLLLVE